jgi:hypothetical protein
MPKNAVAHHKSRVAALTRAVRNGERPADDQDLIDSRRELATANIEAYIAKTLAKAPPLTESQKNALAELLAPVRIQPESIRSGRRAGSPVTDQSKIDAELTINPRRSDARIAKTRGLTENAVFSRRTELGIEPFSTQARARRSA